MTSPRISKSVASIPTVHQDFLKKFQVINMGAPPADSDSPGMSKFPKSSISDSEVHTACVDYHDSKSTPQMWPQNVLCETVYF